MAARRAWWVVPFLAVLVAHLLLGVWMIRSAPNPKIDVFVFQQEGARALLDRRNPYAIENPDIYAGTPQAADRDVYGKELSKDGKLAFGFPYPPLSLGLSTLGYVAGKDHRYAQVVALTLAGGLLGFSRPGRWGALAALLLLFTPRAFFVLGRAWTEPLVVCLLAPDDLLRLPPAAAAPGRARAVPGQQAVPRLRRPARVAARPRPRATGGPP
jgi:hypothetical protein